MKNLSFLPWHNLDIKIRHILDSLTLNLISNKLKTFVMYPYIHKRERNGRFLLSLPKVLMGLIM